MHTPESVKLTSGAVKLTSEAANFTPGTVKLTSEAAILTPGTVNLTSEAIYTDIWACQIDSCECVHRRNRCAPPDGPTKW